MKDITKLQLGGVQFQVIGSVTEILNRRCRKSKIGAPVSVSIDEKLNGVQNKAGPAYFY